jgi:hypothetical protein
MPILWGNEWIDKIVHTSPPSNGLMLHFMCVFFDVHESVSQEALMYSAQGSLFDGLGRGKREEDEILC